jgi:TPR repeat protein
MTLFIGVRRSKWRALQWMRQAAVCGELNSCLRLARGMYLNLPYAREVGHVGEAAGPAMSAGVVDGHDVSPDVLTDVVHWLQKGCVTGQRDPLKALDLLRRVALQGGPYCRNDGCEVLGRPKDFKVCPQCKTARYCGDACQKQDWNAGGHKEKCGTFASESG